MPHDGDHSEHRGSSDRRERQPDCDITSDRGADAIASPTDFHAATRVLRR
jgi:hypothetical protein